MTNEMLDLLEIHDQRVLDLLEIHDQRDAGSFGNISNFGKFKSKLEFCRRKVFDQKTEFRKLPV